MQVTLVNPLTSNEAMAKRVFACALLSSHKLARARICRFASSVRMRSLHEAMAGSASGSGVFAIDRFGAIKAVTPR